MAENLKKLLYSIARGLQVSVAQVLCSWRHNFEATMMFSALNIEGISFSFSLFLVVAHYVIMTLPVKGHHT
jgi:hypothetical protein